MAGVATADYDCFPFLGFLPGLREPRLVNQTVAFGIVDPSDVLVALRAIFVVSLQKRGFW